MKLRRFSEIEASLGKLGAEAIKNEYLMCLLLLDINWLFTIMKQSQSAQTP